MSYANGIIKAPVNQEDVRRALGVDSGDIGTLCTHENINPWAKYKPVIAQNNPKNTDDQAYYEGTAPNGEWKWKNPTSHPNSPATWWKGMIPSVGAPTYGLCGFVLNLFAGITNLFNSYFGSGEASWEWTYQHPTASYWKRLLDFAGYNHNARAAVSLFGSERPTYYSGGSMADTEVIVSASFNQQNWDNGASLSLKDFAALNNRYFGVLVVIPSLSQVGEERQYKIVGYKTMSVTIGNTSYPQVSIPIGTGGITVNSDLTSQKFYIVGFLSDSAKTTFDAASGGGDMYSIGIAKSEFTLYSEGQWISMQILNVGEWNSDYVTGTIRLTTRITSADSNKNAQVISAYHLTIKGKFGSKQDGIDIPDDQLGEPVLDMFCDQTSCQNNGSFVYGNNESQTTLSQPMLDIPVYNEQDISSGVKEFHFKLKNESGTGAVEHPIRTVIANLDLYHGGGYGSYDNTNAQKETDGATVRYNG